MPIQVCPPAGFVSCDRRIASARQRQRDRLGEKIDRLVGRVDEEEQATALPGSAASYREYARTPRRIQSGVGPMQAPFSR
jgi:hypothetical protein